MDLQIIHNNSFLVFPSWGSILGFYTMGEYFRQPVLEIMNDPLIFMACSEVAVPTDKGTIYVIFGVGYYSVKFRVDQNKYIRDNKPITAIVLADFVYDHIATSVISCLQDNPEVVMNQKCIRVPFNIKFATENSKTMLKGLLMRNLFVPYKDVLIEFMNKLKSDKMFNLQYTGHLLLTAVPEAFDTILISDQIIKNKENVYTQPTAGIAAIKEGSEIYLSLFLTPKQLNEIDFQIMKFRDILAAVEFDPINIYSLFERAGLLLKAKILPSGMNIPAVAGKKAWILQSAASKMNEIKPWPDEFERNTKLEKAYENRLDKQICPDVVQVDSYDLGNYTGSIQAPENTIQLRSSQNPVVPQNSPPNVPDNDIEAILIYIREIIDGEYSMHALAEAFEKARDNLLKSVKQADFLWELSKWVNKYQKQPANLGLSPKDKNDMLLLAQGWVDRIVGERLERERKERERLEQIRLEQERIENERREQERLEQERIEQERRAIEEVRLAKEKEEMEKERLERERIENERLRREQELAEQQRLEQEKIRIAREKAEFEQKEKERIEREKYEREHSDEFRKAALEEGIKNAQIGQKQKAQEIKDLKNKEKLLTKELKNLLKQMKKPKK